jgi:hypothetical protein
MKKSPVPAEMELSDYLHSDYLTEAEKDAEADIPVPDRLLPKGRYRQLVGALRLSQKIGLLVWLNRENLLSIGGRERLLYLQSKSSFEALEAGLKFARRLSEESKLISDFKHHMRELNRRPQSKHFRQSEGRRIGVGYRDKGMLPEQSFKARQEAQREALIQSFMIPQELLEIIQKYLPSCLTEDGEWIDLSEFNQDLRVLGELSEITKLLHPL